MGLLGISNSERITCQLASLEAISIYIILYLGTLELEESKMHVPADEDMTQAG